MKREVGRGYGVRGRYGGLPDPYGSLSHAKIVVLPVEFDQTCCYQKGTRRGPKALIEASRYMELYDIETDSQVYLQGIYTAPPIRAKSSKEMLDKVYQRTKEILKQNRFVAMIGGEHSISYATIRAHAERYQRLTVLQLDAHADLADAYEGNPWSHGSVMARVKELSEVDRIVSVGIRSLAHNELRHLDRPNTFFAQEIVDSPHWMEHVLGQLEGPIYITLDVDVFDSSLMPSTGTPEPGGLFWYDVLKLLKLVAQHRQVVGFDVVELLPRAIDPAPDFLAAKLVYKMLSYINELR